MTREHILNSVWGNDYLGEPRVVDTLIKRLRQKIFTEHDRNRSGFDIVTVFGIGYKLEELGGTNEK